MRAAFESPLREQRARTELVRLIYGYDETVPCYMARLKILLTKIPEHDIQMALHQWTLGLRQPFKVELAKMYPKTLGEAEAMAT